MRSLKSNPKMCPVCRRAPKCIVWIPFGLIDSCIWFGCLAVWLLESCHNGSCLSPCFGNVTSCDLDVKGPDTKSVSWYSLFLLLDQSFFKTGFVPWIEFNYLAWQPPGWKMKVLKMSRPVIGWILSAGWPARRANQPDHLQSCNRHQPKWLSQNKALALKLLASRGWPSRSSSTSWVLDEGRKCSQSLAFISPGSNFSFKDQWN